MNKEIMTVGILSAMDVNDRRLWAGLPYQMYKALQEEFVKVIPLGPARIPIAIVLLIFCRDLFYRLTTRKRYSRYHNTIVSKYLGRHFKNKLKNLNVDILFAPVASTEIANLNTHIPICYLSDTSFSQIRQDGFSYTGYALQSILESENIEKQAIERADGLIYPSLWAAEHTIKHYGVNPNHIHIVKFGANFDNPPEKTQYTKQIGDQINLLFLGIDWERKGGDIALDSLKVLLSRKHHVTLTVCGCIPPVSHPNMRVIPFLNKNIESEREAFHKILSESHILFLPTRAECFGIVFCEAAAYGLPVVSTNTGGVGSAVDHQITGYLLTRKSSPADYANMIEKIIKNPDLYHRLSKNAREKYEKELNWDVWGKHMRRILKEIYFRSLAKKVE